MINWSLFSPQKHKKTDEERAKPRERKDNEPAQLEHVENSPQPLAGTSGLSLVPQMTTMQPKAVTEAFEITLPPELLEEGWTSEWCTTYNRPYFFNHNTRESIWEVPKAVTEAFEVPLPPELLEKGWTSEWCTTYNRPYFFNHNTRDSIWEVPSIQHVSSGKGKGKGKKSRIARTRDEAEHVEAEPQVRVDGKQNRFIFLVFLFLRMRHIMFILFILQRIHRLKKMSLEVTRSLREKSRKKIDMTQPHLHLIQKISSQKPQPPQ